MKRFLTFIITLILTATLFAESYKVVKVEGKVFATTASRASEAKEDFIWDAGEEE